MFTIFKDTAYFVPSHDFTQNVSIRGLIGFGKLSDWISLRASSIYRTVTEKFDESVLYKTAETS